MTDVRLTPYRIPKTWLRKEQMTRSLSLNFPPHLKGVATLPCVTVYVVLWIAWQQFESMITVHLHDASQFVMSFQVDLPQLEDLLLVGMWTLLFFNISLLLTFDLQLANMIFRQRWTFGYRFLGPTPLKFCGGRGTILNNFTLWLQISPERIEVPKVWKAMVDYNPSHVGRKEIGKLWSTNQKRYSKVKYCKVRLYYSGL